MRDDQLRHIRHLDGEDRHGRRTLATVMRYRARAELARGRVLRDLALYRSGRLTRVAAAAEVPRPATDRTNEPERREECTNEPGEPTASFQPDRTIWPEYCQAAAVLDPSLAERPAKGDGREATKAA